MFQCEFCISRFVEKNKLRNHLRDVHKIYMCNKCDELIPIVKIENHLCSPNKKEDKLFSCDHCDRKYKRSSYLEKHKIEIHGIRTEPRIMPPKVDENISCIKIENDNHKKVELEEHSRVQSLNWKKGTTENNSLSQYSKPSYNKHIDKSGKSN